MLSTCRSASALFPDGELSSWDQSDENSQRSVTSKLCLLGINCLWSKFFHEIKANLDTLGQKGLTESRSHLHTEAGVRLGVVFEGSRPESSASSPPEARLRFLFQGQTNVEEPLSQSEAAARRMNARGSVTFLFTLSKRTFVFLDSLSNNIFALFLRLLWNCCRRLRFEESV